MNRYADKERRKSYCRWRQMIRRCTDPAAVDWIYYGGRGIAVCDRWMRSVDAFIQDLGPVPEGMTLDRIDSDGDYCPENVRWADSATQHRNRRNAEESRTECLQGHPYNETNTYVTPRGKRDCRTCRRDAARRYRAQKARAA